MTAEAKKEEGPRSFTRFLEKLDHGSCHMEASRQLHELTKKCASIARQKRDVVQGQITLKVKLTADDTGVVTAAYDIETKEPKPPRSGTVFFCSKGGNLVDENPRQTDMFSNLRDVNKEQEHRDVAEPEDVRDAEGAE